MRAEVSVRVREDWEETDRQREGMGRVVCWSVCMHMCVSGKAGQAPGSLAPSPAPGPAGGGGGGFRAAGQCAEPHISLNNPELAVNAALQSGPASSFNITNILLIIHCILMGSPLYTYLVIA